MLKIAHRINTIELLKKTPEHYGVELDLRTEKDRIIIHHDAFQKGEDFEEWLKNYKHQTLILNTKTEGMEERILKLLELYNIEDYFFLDLSLPFLIKYMNKGVRKIAVRFSEYEPLEFVLKFAGKIDWLWVDCFNNLPLTTQNYPLLKKHFKLCIVSPELQGYPLERIEEFKQKLKSMEIDAVCTKRPDLWD